MGTTATIFLFTLLGLWIIGFVYMTYKFNSKGVKELNKKCEIFKCPKQPTLKQSKRALIKALILNRLDIESIEMHNQYNLDDRKLTSEIIIKLNNK